MRCNLAVISDITGISVVTIKKRVDEDGFPCLARPDGVKRGGTSDWTFDTIDVIEYLAGRDVAPKASPKADAQTREAIATAGLKELDLAERQGTLINLDKLMGPIDEMLAVVKSLIGAIPGRMAQTLAAESDPARVQVLLRDEINLALTGLNTLWDSYK